MGRATAQGAFAVDNEIAQLPQDQDAPVPIVDDRLLELALRFNRHHWRSHGRTASADALRRHLRIGSAKARSLARAIKEHDLAMLSTADSPARQADVLA